jgi:hypothetical protein
MVNGFGPRRTSQVIATVIQSLPKTIGLPNERMMVLDQLRKKRNLSDYSGVGIAEEVAAACVRAAEDLATTVEKLLRANRSDLMGQCSKPRERKQKIL